MFFNITSFSYSESTKGKTLKLEEANNFHITFIQIRHGHLGVPPPLNVKSQVTVRRWFIMSYLVNLPASIYYASFPSNQSNWEAFGRYAGDLLKENAK